jgi:hypothetical protein
MGLALADLPAGGRLGVWNGFDVVSISCSILFIRQSIEKATGTGTGIISVWLPAINTLCMP